MSHNADYLLALEIQNRWQAENHESDSDLEIVDIKPAPIRLSRPKVRRTGNNTKGKYRSNMDEEFVNRMENLVHPLWEMADCTPNIRVIFDCFDSRFFQNRLKPVRIDWAEDMLSTAAVCYLLKKHEQQHVHIMLSKPLLVLRPRKDLVDCLLVGIVFFVAL